MSIEYLFLLTPKNYKGNFLRSFQKKNLLIGQCVNRSCVHFCINNPIQDNEAC